MIRVASTVPRFVDMGIATSTGWSPVDPADPNVRAFLERYVGRFVRVHPDDVAKLGTFNMALHGGRLVQVAPAPPATEADPAAPAAEPARRGVRR